MRVRPRSLPKIRIVIKRRSRSPERSRSPVVSSYVVKL
jgi:hypothetical protein